MGGGWMDPESKTDCINVLRNEGTHTKAVLYCMDVGNVAIFQSFMLPLCSGSKPSWAGWAGWAGVC
jgi:hypothetical protein